MNPPIVIVTGGQSGVDLGAWRAAKAIELGTSGWMPAGYETEDGPRPEYAEQFGAQALRSSGYGRRTAFNVRDSDGLLLLAIKGRPEGPGTRLTEKLAAERIRIGPYPHSKLAIDPAAEPMPDERQRRLVARLLAAVIREVRAGRPGGGPTPRPMIAGCPTPWLMVAGSRESSCPGIGEWAEAFLTDLLGRRCPECLGEGVTERDPSGAFAMTCPVCDGLGLIPAAACYGEPEGPDDA